MKVLGDDSLAEEQGVLISLLTGNKAEKQPTAAPGYQIPSALTPAANYRTQRALPRHTLQEGKDTARIRETSKDGIVTVKMLINHPNTSLKYTQKTGKPFNYIEHIRVSINRKTVCEFYTSQNISKDPYFSCRFKNYGVKNGDTLVFEYADFNGRYVYERDLRRVE